MLRQAQMGGIYISILGEPLIRERSLVVNPAFQSFRWVATVVRRARKPFLVFYVFITRSALPQLILFHGGPQRLCLR
jgi:hypothetical protein